MAAVRLHRIKGEYGEAIRVVWRNYPLAVNPRPEARISEHSVEGRQRANFEPEGIHFNPWPDDEPYPVTSLPALRATACARLQSEAAFDRLHIAIFKKFFEECRNIEDEQVLFGLANDAGLDMRRFRADYRRADADREILADHKYYEENFQGWGVPFVVVGGRYPLAGAVPIEMYRRAIELCLGRVKSGG